MYPEPVQGTVQYPLTPDSMCGVDVMGTAKPGTTRCAAKICGIWRQVIAPQIRSSSLIWLSDT